MLTHVLQAKHNCAYSVLPIIRTTGLSSYVLSSLSNKRGVTLIDFEKKFHPPRTFPPSTFIDFLDFFHPPLHAYCIYVLVFSNKSHPPRLFQPPRLLILQLLHSLHVYSNLQVIREMRVPESK